MVLTARSKPCPRKRLKRVDQPKPAGDVLFLATGGPVSAVKNTQAQLSPYREALPEIGVYRALVGATFKFGPELGHSLGAWNILSEHSTCPEHQRGSHEGW